MDERMCFCVEKILKYESFDYDILYNYFDYDREINQDIKGLNNLHTFSNIEDIINLIKKVYEKIDLEDKSYFKNQMDVINIYNALLEIKSTTYKLDKKIYTKLMKIAKDLYEPSLKEVKQFELSYWEDIDYTGTIVQNLKLNNIISDINEINSIKYNDLIKIEVENALKKEEYNKLNDLLIHIYNLKIDVKIDYKNMFSRLFEIIKYDATIFKCLTNIYMLIGERHFLDKIDSEDIVFMYRKEYLNECISWFEYSEYQEKKYEELEKEVN